MSRIEELLAQVAQKQDVTPSIGDADARIADFTLHSGFLIPDDVTAFYRQFSRASLFEGAFELLPVPEWRRVNVAVYGEVESDDGCPDSWYAFCDMRDGDYVGIILSREDTTPAKNILDCNHENLTPTSIIACSFTEFLERLLEAGEYKYWLGANFKPYRTVTYEPSVAYWRRTHRGFWNRIGPEVGPLVCDEAGCEGLRAAHSTRCRRHHYEMLIGYPCPFNDDE